MKNLLFGIIALAVCGILGFVVWNLVANKAPTQTQPSDSSGSFGTPADNGSQTNPQHVYPAPLGATSTSSVVQTMTLPAVDKSSIVVKNFKNDASTVKDPVNDGLLYLGNHTFNTSDSPANLQAPYYMFYEDSSQSFTISLNQEPIYQTRLQAEQYLMQRLGIGQDQMCKLKYTISAPNFVSPLYAGVNLLFSFCTGAVKLAQ